jgi:inosine/xanthosine triphosphatase
VPKILAGSKNPVKIRSVIDAFEKYFEDVEVIGFDVNSKVSDQPVNEETFEGAKNRAFELIAKDKRENLNADYFVGIEGGIIQLYSKWFAFGCMCIADKQGKTGFGTSAHFELPKGIVDELLNGKELGDVMDAIQNKSNTKQKHGAIGYFTNGVMGRAELYVPGLITALMEDLAQNGKTALVFGASGLVGSHLIQKLLDEHYFPKIFVFVRKYLKINNPRITEHIIDFDNLNSYSEVLKGEAVFCCLGTTIKKAGSQSAFKKVDFDYPLTIGRLSKDNNVKQFLLVSSIGANINSKAFYLKLKGEIEQEIIKLRFDKTSIFRPSFLVGDRQEKRSGEKIVIAVAKIFSFLFLGKLKKYKPISAESVAKAMFIASKAATKDIVSFYESNQIQQLAGN